MSDVILVPGEVRGYRLWRVVGDTLHAYRKAVRMEPAERYTATCRRVDVIYNGKPRPGHSEAPPADGCTCGFYGVYAGGLFETFRANSASFDALASPKIVVVVGAVAYSGRVVFGETGVMRAEHMRIEALYAPPKFDVERQLVYYPGSPPEHLSIHELGRRYRVPACTSVAQFLYEWPLQDLTDLIGEPKTGWFLSPEEDRLVMVESEARHTYYHRVLAFDEAEYYRRTVLGHKQQQLLSTKFPAIDKTEFEKLFGIKLNPSG